MGFIKLLHCVMEGVKWKLKLGLITDHFVHVRFRLTLTCPFQTQDHSVKKSCGGIRYNVISLRSAVFILLLKHIFASIWKLL